jgi:hypothetical protein
VIQTLPIVGRLLSIRATFECGGCGKQFSVFINPAHLVPEGWSAYDEAVDAVRGGRLVDGPSGGSAVVGGYLLCEQCTSKLPESVEFDTADPEWVKEILGG